MKIKDYMPRIYFVELSLLQVDLHEYTSLNDVPSEILTADIHSFGIIYNQEQIAAVSSIWDVSFDIVMNHQTIGCVEYHVSLRDCIFRLIDQVKGDCNWAETLL